MDARWTVGGDDDGGRLDKFLAAANRLGSRGRARSALERGKVIVNGAEAGRQDGARHLVLGDVVRVWMDRPGSATKRLNTVGGSDLGIVYEDAALLVLNKPAGLLAVPLAQRSGAPSVYDLIKSRLRSLGKQRPFVVHRIDRDTSGLVIFARSARAQAELRAQFRRREPERVYWAVVYGRPNPPLGTWQDYLVWDEDASIQKATHRRDPRANEAISHYRVIEAYPSASLLEVRLETGKRNQIRLQARLRGHTLVGERRYVFGPDSLRPITFARQALHAYRLAFRHPTDGRALQFEAPLPADLVQLIAGLRRPH